MEVSNKQIWDSEEYIFLPLVTELLSIKVVGSASRRGGWGGGLCHISSVVKRNPRFSSCL